MAEHIIKADTDYVIGHLRKGHYELELSDAEYKYFKELDTWNQREYIKDNGNFIIDETSIHDIGNITKIYES